MPHLLGALAELHDSDDESETAPVRELSTLQALQCADFWLILLQALVGVGTGLGFINSISGQVVALGGQLGGQLVFVSLFSVANASGKLRRWLCCWYVQGLY